MSTNIISNVLNQDQPGERSLEFIVSEIKKNFYFSSVRNTNISQTSTYIKDSFKSIDFLLLNIREDFDDIKKVAYNLKNDGTNMTFEYLKDFLKEKLFSSVLLYRIKSELDALKETALEPIEAIENLLLIHP